MYAMTFAILLAGIVSAGSPVFQGTPQAPAYPVFETDKLPPSLYAKRREAIKAEIGPGGIAFVFTNPDQVRSNDTSFRFRPDSYFTYLTGFEEPDAVLVLAPSGVEIGGRRTTEVMFCNTSNPMSETWLGHRMNPQNVVKLLGIEAAAPNQEFKSFLTTLKNVSATSLGGNSPQLYAQYKDWFTSGQIPPLKTKLLPVLDRMRVKKDPLELALLKKAVDASVIGHREAMKTAQPNMREYEVQAVVEYAFTRAGCESVGYNSIVGSGPNSCILHYEEDRKLMQNGEIICMDVAGEYHGYSADVTRSFPVNGKFSPEQRAIYEIVLAAQNAGIAECKVGRSFNAPHEAATKVIVDGLTKLGIIKNAAEVQRYFMHGTSHYIGLDVHDSQGDDTLRPSYTLTVEPGIYIKAGSPCDKKWWNIGVRIEDDILVTEAGPVNMSAAAPRSVSEIEALMKDRGLGNLPIGK
jgi:Xaa-Pro aminopeptidase